MKSILLLGALLPFAVTAATIEAESGTIVNPKGAKIENVAKASGGKVVKMLNLKRGNKAPAKDEAAGLVIKYNAEKDGFYKVTAFINAATGGNDSVYYALDGNTPKDFHTGEKKVNFPLVLEKRVKLAPGDHELKFWTREGGFEFDKFEIEEVK